jgi:periplasmic protein TonB
VKILKSFNADIDKEALKIAAGMPAWTPGKLNGKPVDVIMDLPIIIDTK